MEGYRPPPKGFRPPPPPPQTHNYNHNHRRSGSVSAGHRPPAQHYSTPQQQQPLRHALPQRPGAIPLPPHPGVATTSYSLHTPKDNNTRQGGSGSNRGKGKSATVTFTPLSATFCEFCQMDFGTEPLLDAHTKLKHLACNFCLFNGERADLDAHVNAAHPGKLIPRSKKHEDPAEIAAWIAARKKKYPTKANIQKKIQEKQEKLASGMLVSTATQSSLKRDRATRLVQEGEADDDDAGKRGEDDPNAMSLEEGEEEATSPVHGGAGAAQRKRQFPCKYFAMGKCKNGDDCMYMHIKEATVLKKDRPALGGGKRRNLRDMLVESQIRRQNNIILQCIRFVLNDKRFGVGPPQPK